MSLGDRAEASDNPGYVFFDRGLIDAASALEHAAGRPVVQGFAEERYHRRIFMVPPWPEIYVPDAERKHGLDEAIAEYERLLKAFTSLNYDVVVLPKVGVAQRADMILRCLHPD
ncbi:MAG: hypothetical protein JWR77_162 [Rhizorhabdus sp.]|nr:hypothetical protein [Rhizorhabdus sp.]